MQTYKIAIVSDGGVDKTQFINRHLTNIFTPKYIPTKGVDIHPISFNTNYGNLLFNIWNTAGHLQIF
jgi:GTP-binding nuclear protein Ran